MKNPNKKWSWKKSFKNATGSAASGASAGAMVGIIDPTGATALGGALIGAATGFTGQFVGDGVGYLWDDYPPIEFSSYALFNFVIGLLILLPIVFVIGLGEFESDKLTVFGATSFVVAMITSSGARLIDDIRDRMSKELFR